MRAAGSPWTTPARRTDSLAERRERVSKIVRFGYTVTKTLEKEATLKGVVLKEEALDQVIALETDFEVNANNDTIAYAVKMDRPREECFHGNVYFSPDAGALVSLTLRRRKGRSSYTTLDQLYLLHARYIDPVTSLDPDELLRHGVYGFTNVYNLTTDPGEEAHHLDGIQSIASIVQRATLRRPGSKSRPDRNRPALETLKQLLVLKRSHPSTEIIAALDGKERHALGKKSRVGDEAVGESITNASSMLFWVLGQRPRRIHGSRGKIEADFSGLAVANAIARRFKGKAKDNVDVLLASKDGDWVIAADGIAVVPISSIGNDPADGLSYCSIHPGEFFARFAESIMVPEGELDVDETGEQRLKRIFFLGWSVGDSDYSPLKGANLGLGADGVKKMAIEARDRLSVLLEAIEAKLELDEEAWAKLRIDIIGAVILTTVWTHSVSEPLHGADALLAIMASDGLKVTAASPVSKMYMRHTAGRQVIRLRDEACVLLKAESYWVAVQAVLDLPQHLLDLPPDTPMSNLWGSPALPAPPLLGLPAFLLASYDRLAAELALEEEGEDGDKDRPARVVGDMGVVPQPAIAVELKKQPAWREALSKLISTREKAEAKALVLSLGQDRAVEGDRLRANLKQHDPSRSLCERFFEAAAALRAFVQRRGPSADLACWQAPENEAASSLQLLVAIAKRELNENPWAAAADEDRREGESQSGERRIGRGEREMEAAGAAVLLYFIVYSRVFEVDLLTFDEALSRLLALERHHLIVLVPLKRRCENLIAPGYRGAIFIDYHGSHVSLDDRVEDRHLQDLEKAGSGSAFLSLLAHIDAEPAIYRWRQLRTPVAVSFDLRIDKNLLEREQAVIDSSLLTMTTKR